jgi:hypothetical protein
MKNFLSSLPFTSAAKAAAGFVALTARQSRALSKPFTARLKATPFQNFG